MKIEKHTRFEKKADVIFWLLVTFLPIILYIVNAFSGISNDFFAFVGENFTFDFVANVFNDLFMTAFNSTSPVVNLLSYFVSVEILHILYDVIVFLPRFARKAFEV